MWNEQVSEVSAFRACFSNVCHMQFHLSRFHYLGAFARPLDGFQGCRRQAFFAFERRCLMNVLEGSFRKEVSV